VQQNLHSILIEAQPKDVFPQILLWGESKWWPKNSQMKFIRETPGEIKIGTRYLQRVLLPLAPQWEVEVNIIEPGKKVGRKFLNGIFSGVEWVELEPVVGLTKVKYIMNFEVNGILNRGLWNLFFRRLHDRNLEVILANLRDFIVNKK